MGHRKTVIRTSLIASAVLMLWSGSAFAQATRTWVSGVGDDANPCSRTAPCKTFAGAISKTAAGGIINCLDPGGFGTLSITKSITVSCKHVEGSSLASSATGIIVNGAGIDVVLRGLDIDGSPPTLPGVNGIRYLQGASLIVEDCIIRDFTSASPNGNGIIVNNTSGVADLLVVNSYISGNGNGAGGAGIELLPSGTGSVRATIRGTQLLNNVVGIRANTNSTTGTIDVSVADSTMAGASFHGVVAIGNTTAARVMLNDVLVANNLGEGLRSSGPAAIIRYGDSVVTGNGTGFAAVSSGALVSYGNNQIDGNTALGAGTGSIPLN